jgi:hypothetical protein
MGMVTLVLADSVGDRLGNVAKTVLQGIGAVVGLAVALALAVAFIVVCTMIKDNLLYVAGAIGVGILVCLVGYVLGFIVVTEVGLGIIFVPIGLMFLGFLVNS